MIKHVKTELEASGFIRENYLKVVYIGETDYIPAYFGLDIMPLYPYVLRGRTQKELINRFIDVTNGKKVENLIWFEDNLNFTSISWHKKV